MALRPPVDSVDLLEERRAELGVPTEPAVIVPARDLLWKGGSPDLPC